jgi:MFS family permease
MILHYTLFQVFFSGLLWMPVFYEFQKRIGLAPAQIFSIQSFYYVVFCLLEIPTGWMADRLGRARCLRLGAWVVAVSNLPPLLSISRPELGYLFFALHFLLIALARSLVSGASSAWLFDRLQVEGRAHDYRRIEGNARSWGLAVKIALWPAVAPLMEWKLGFPYAATLALTALGIWHASRLGEGRTVIAAPTLGAGFLASARRDLGVLLATARLLIHA